MMLRCVSMAAFGSPSLPLVNIIEASFPPPSVGIPNIRMRALAGSSLTAASFFATPLRPIDLRIFETSRKFSGHGNSGIRWATFSLSFSALMTVFTPAFLKHARAASAPMVKFMLTLTRPAIWAAMLTAFPAIPEGRAMPIRASRGIFFFM